MTLPPPSLSLASLSLGSPLAPVGTRALPPGEPAGEWFLSTEAGARICLPVALHERADVGALAQRVLDHLIAR